MYDQTLHRAREVGLSICRVPEWFDVDRQDDVTALRRRLPPHAAVAADGPDPALRRPAERPNELPDDPAWSGRHALMNENDMLSTLPGNASEAELPDLADGVTDPR